MNGLVDISKKEITRRKATAQAVVKLKKRVLTLIKEGQILKGDVLEQARLAGIMASKRTSDIIPLCHPLAILDIKISFTYFNSGIRIVSYVVAMDRTGVEMEALVACAVSALTIYDMCKMYDRSIEIADIMLLEKKGGESGELFKRKL
ncbi:MAG: Cyclic pyranopterin monophosphate synthase 2 [candidate division WS2 bacterium]|nr:Cyclic pyranopterin monophosphate synthase 2 [Candidatus Psychracetigena formicireducens]